MITPVIFLILGFILLIKSADWLITGASALAKRYGISDLAIGLTIVAAGTSAPELAVNVFASIQNHHDIVFGNIIGSNNFNLFIILGITGLITPLVIQSGTVWKEIPISFIAIIVLFVIANDFFSSAGEIVTRFDGLFLLILFGVFLFYVFKQVKSTIVLHETEVKHFSTFRIWAYIIIGLAGLIIGGRLIVHFSVQVAEMMGISEKIIGLTIVAAGTSLPELATSLVAVLKKNTDIAVGNVIGSNIFNILFILGISALVRPIGFDTSFNTDLYILAFGTLILFSAMFTGKKRKLDRWEAAILLAIYIAYTIYLVK